MAVADASDDGFAVALAFVLADVQRRVLAEHHRSRPGFSHWPSPERAPSAPPPQPRPSQPQPPTSHDGAVECQPPGAVPEPESPSRRPPCSSGCAVVPNAEQGHVDTAQQRPEPSSRSFELPGPEASAGKHGGSRVSFCSLGQGSLCDSTRNIKAESRRFELLEPLQNCFSACTGNNRARAVTRDAFRLDASTLLKLKHSNLSTHFEDSWFYSSVQRLVISPGALVQLVWEVAALIFVFFDCVWLTLRLFDPPDFFLIFLLGWVSRSFWAVNMPFSCFCGYIDDAGAEVVDPICVVKRYLRSWFLLDILVVMLDLAEVALQRGGGLWIRVFRVTRILRLCRARKSLRMLEERIRSEALVVSGTLLRVLGVMAALSHLIAGLWFYVGHGREDGWVQDYSMHPADTDLLERYSFAFHFALALFAGEHVILPRNMGERWFVCVAFTFTFMMAVYMQSTITTAMTRITIVEQKRTWQLRTLSRYLWDNGISDELALKVNRNATYALITSERTAPESSVELLQMISDPLKSEIHFEIYSPIINIHPFFSCYNAENTTGVRKICHDCVSRHLFSSGDVVFVEEEVPATPSMLFVLSGVLEYVREDSELKRQEVTASHWVSEPVLWTHWTHRGTLYASDCEVMFINASRFVNCISQFPCSRVRVYAQEFLKALNSQDVVDLTDLASSSTSMLVAPIENAFPGRYTTHNQQLTPYSRQGTLGRSLDSIMSRGSATGRSVASRASTAIGLKNSGSAWRFSTLTKSVTSRSRCSNAGTPLPLSTVEPRRTTGVADDRISEELEFVAPTSVRGKSHVVRMEEDSRRLQTHIQ